MTEQAFDYGTCQCCGNEPAVGVAAVPGVPMSIAWGRKCLDARVMPYWLVVANTAVLGGLERAADWWVGYVERTLAYFGKSEAEFAAEVGEAVREISRPPEGTDESHD